MTDAILIGSPDIKLETLFSAAANTLGFQLTKSIDNSPPVSDSAKFISALSALYERNLPTVRENVQQAGPELFYLYYLFLCYADKSTAFKVREWTKLDILSNFSLDGEIIFIAGGSLAVWKHAVMVCCVESSPSSLRRLFDKIVLLLEREGLGDLWGGQRKRTLQDKTFLLEDKS